MTTYSTIADGQIDQDSPMTQPLLTALRDNPIAIAERASGAPFIQHMWHPYDADFSGDGDGVIYDHSVDGDVFSFESPTFEAGFDYFVRCEKLEISPDVRFVTLEVLRETTATWQFVSNLNGASASRENYAYFQLDHPYRVSKSHVMPFQFEAEATAGDGVINDAVNSWVIGSATAQRLSKFRLTMINIGAVIAGGKVYMFKRKALI